MNDNTTKGNQVTDKTSKTFVIRTFAEDVPSPSSSPRRYEGPRWTSDNSSGAGSNSVFVIQHAKSSRGNTAFPPAFGRPDGRRSPIPETALGSTIGQQRAEKTDWPGQ